MRKLIRGVRTVHRVAGPACTLLLASVLLALISSLARAMPEPATPIPPPALMMSELPNALQPGDAFSFKVRLDRGEAPRLRAYLPGLDQQRVELRYDPIRQRYVGRLRLPWFTPTKGRATLRVVGEGVSWDLPLRLGASEPS